MMEVLLWGANKECKKACAFKWKGTTALPGSLKYAYLGLSKLKPRWDDPFIVREVFKHGAVVVEDLRDGRILKVNEQSLKPYLGGVILEEETMSLEIPTYWDATWTLKEHYEVVPYLF